VNVTITAVADTPDLSYEVLSGTPVDKIVLRVTATQTDFDSSEFIDRLEWSVAGGLPAGVSIVPLGLNPGTEPDQIVQDSRSRFRSDRIRTSI
jgi:hypothetical protein